MIADVFFDRVAKAQIEESIIHTDDRVRFACDRQGEELSGKPPAFEQFSNPGDARGRMLGHVKSQFNAGSRHLCSARAEEFRLPGNFARSAETSSAASRSPLVSPAMSMKVLGFIFYLFRRRLT